MEYHDVGDFLMVVLPPVVFCLTLLIGSVKVIHSHITKKDGKIILFLPVVLCASGALALFSVLLAILWPILILIAVWGIIYLIILLYLFIKIGKNYEQKTDQ